MPFYARRHVARAGQAGNGVSEGTALGVLLHGWAFSGRGRLPSDVVEAYDAAHK